MKKIIAWLSAVAFWCTAFVSAAISPEKQAALEIASERIVDIMNENDNVDHIDLLDAVAHLQNVFEGDDVKVEMLDILLHMTMDAYFMVDNFLYCELYYDGCNNCTIHEWYNLACTKKACVEREQRECLQYVEMEEEMIDLNMDQVAILCEDQWGTRDVMYHECHGIDAMMCEEYGGRFEECGSACRHDPEAEICTLQCVIYCDFSQLAEKQECMFNGGEWMMNWHGFYSCYTPSVDQWESCMEASDCDEYCRVEMDHETNPQEGECTSFMWWCLTHLAEDGMVLTICE